MAYADLSLREISFNLRSAEYELGQVLDEDYLPTKLSSYAVSIPDLLLGNEAKQGFGAFSLDGIYADRGSVSCTENNFLGFFTKKSYDINFEKSDYLSTFFTAPIISRGRVCVYASTAILLNPEIKTYLITNVTSTTPSTFEIGSIAQGTLPSSVTYIDITTFCKIKLGTKSAGSAIVLDILLRK